MNPSLIKAQLQTHSHLHPECSLLPTSTCHALPPISNQNSLSLTLKKIFTTRTRPRDHTCLIFTFKTNFNSGPTSAHFSFKTHFYWDQTFVTKFTRPIFSLVPYLVAFSWQYSFSLKLNFCNYIHWTITCPLFLVENYFHWDSILFLPFPQRPNLPIISFQRPILILKT